MTDANRVLEEAISDVGYWRWWAEALPRVFQVEFGGVQLWNPPAQEGAPPSGVVALRFVDPSLVVFLTETGAMDLDPDWPAALHEDRLEPFTVDHDQFTLTEDDKLASLAKDCELRFLVGDHGGLAAGNDPVRLGFRAGACRARCASPTSDRSLHQWRNEPRTDHRSVCGLVAVLEGLLEPQGLRESASQGLCLRGDDSPEGRVRAGATPAVVACMAAASAPEALWP